MDLSKLHHATQKLQEACLETEINQIWKAIEELQEKVY